MVEKSVLIVYKMSSSLRSPATRKEGLTRFVKPESPSYNNGSEDVLFPFSYSNQVLDITYTGNNFKSRMVDVSNQSPDNAPGGEPDTIISILGGLYLATSLGPNFKAYIRAWRTGIDAGSPIEVVVPAQLIRVQEAGSVSSNSDESWAISSSAPSGDNYVSGDATNNFHTTYVFKTPLTFSLFEGGVKKYITFKTALDQE
jgi:hypothetical protein